MNCEDCVNSTVNGNVRIAVTVDSAIGLALESVILLIIVCAKAYRSFLQRLFIWIVLSLLVLDSMRVASIGYGQANFQDFSCEVMGFVFVWSYWILFLFLVVLIVSMSTILYIQTRDRSVVITKCRSLRLPKELLEVGIVVGTLTLPLIVLWMPFRDNQYGYNGFLCGLKISNYSTFGVLQNLYSNIPMELAGLVSVIASLGVIIYYCTLSSEMKRLKKVRRVIKNLVVSLVIVFLFSMASNVLALLQATISVGYQSFSALAWLSILVVNLERIVFLVGYLLVFHFSKVCSPVKKLCNCRRKGTHNSIQRNCNEYGTFRDSNKSTAPSQTFFNVSYTGEFTTISNA